MPSGGCHNAQMSKFDVLRKGSITSVEKKCLCLRKVTSCRYLGYCRLAVENSEFQQQVVPVVTICSFKKMSSSQGDRDRCRNCVKKNESEPQVVGVLSSGSMSQQC